MAFSLSNISGSLLLERLRAWLRSPKKAGDGNRVPHRRGLSIATCIFLAVLLWFTLSLRKVQRVSLPIQTMVQNLPDSLALTRLPPPTIQVDIEGEASALLGLYWNPPVLAIDARQQEIDLRSVALEGLQGVTVLGVSPSSQILATELRVERALPIRLRGRVEPAATVGWVHPPQLSPDTLLVSGARSVLNGLTYWPTEPYFKDKVRDSLSVTLALKDTLQDLIRWKSHSQTVLTAVARPFTEGSRIISVEVTGLPSSQRMVSLEPSTVTVRYQVPLSQYERAETAPDFFATVSYEAIRTDTTGRIRPRINYPAGVFLRNVEITPSSLRYYERLLDQ